MGGHSEQGGVGQLRGRAAAGALCGIHRPISARFSVTFWKGFGGSPIPFNLTICVRKQGQFQVPARLAQLALARTTVRPISDEKKNDGTPAYTWPSDSKYW